MIKTEANPWFVLRTKSRHENIVEGSLKQKKINLFLPRREETSLSSNRRKHIDVPLFPGYVFVQPNPQQFEQLRFIPGSCGLVLVGNTPAKMPEKDLEGVKIMAKSGAKLSVNSQLIPGKKVEVLSGPLKGVHGEIVRIKNKQRLIINAHLLERSIDVEITSEKINVL